MVLLNSLDEPLREKYQQNLATSSLFYKKL